MGIWEKAKGVLGLVAPTIGAAIGGPLGGIAGRELASALGLTPDTPEEGVAAAVAGATPEQLAVIRQADYAFQAKMRELDIDLEKVHQADRASARQREIATGDRTPMALAFLVTAGFFGVLAYLLVNGVPQHGGEALLVMLGSLGTAWTAIVSYYYGSSVGSKAKTAELASFSRR